MPKENETYLRISTDGKFIEMRQLIDHDGSTSVSGKSQNLYTTGGNITVGQDSRDRKVVAGINIYTPIKK